MKFAPYAQLKGLREDPVPPFTGTSGSIGFAAIFQMIVALVVVLLLIKWLVPKYISKFAKRAAHRASSELKIDHAANVAGGQLLLVTTRGRTLLVGAGTNGFSTLADVTDEQDAPSPGSAGDFGAVLERLKRLQG